MDWSLTLIPTLKEAPADAGSLSHKLLLRAGLVRKSAPGLYTLLPLGLRVVRKIETLLRQEFERAGAHEILLPSLHQPELWRQSGRADALQESWLKVRDHAGREFLLCPAPEEAAAALAATEISSYRQLPRAFYQIQSKLRDEPRPRSGLLRTRESLALDAWTFDTSETAAEESARRITDACARVFARCGLQPLEAEAAPGILCRQARAFILPAQAGEDDFAACPSGRYAAMLDVASSRGPLLPTPCADTGPAPEKFPTPGVATIDDLAAPAYGVAPERQIKTLVFQSGPRPVIVLLRGDDQLSEAKLSAALGAVLRPALADEILAAVGAHPGSLGAVNSTRRDPLIPVYADTALRDAAGMVTGACEDGFHLRHVNLERDIRVTAWHDLRLARAGELSVGEGLPLLFQRGIELGRASSLGRQLSEKLNATVIDESGQSRPCVMGSWTIHLARLLQAVVEQCNDKDGILWPPALAPFQVLLTPLSATPGSPALQIARSIRDQLAAQGVEVLLDDRDERPGVKFKDADLIGIPLRAGLGEKSLARDEIEIKPRGGAMTSVKTSDAVATLLQLVRQLAR